MKYLKSPEKILAFSLFIEAAVGLAVVFNPGIVSRLLFGSVVDETGAAFARCFGIALIALILACWPAWGRPENGPVKIRAMITYNAFVTLYFVWLGTSGALAGILLWPAVGFHSVIGLLLITIRRAE
jgi:hypothetical protein